MTAPSLDQHRSDIDTLIALALAALRRLWRPGDPVAIRDSLTAGLPALAQQYGSAAATLGADWYDEMRDAADVNGRFRAIVAELPDQGRLGALVGWGTQPLFEPTDPVLADSFVPDLEAAQSRVEGGFQRLVADADRNSVIASLEADPQGRGWSRQTTGKSCPFCLLLAGRGAVYSAKTADFASHDRCDCVAVPVFGGDPRPVQPYVPSQRNRSDAVRKADNARVREYLRTT